MKKIGITTIVSFLLVLSGCTYSKMYQGESLPPQKIAKIKTDSHLVGISHVDQKKTYNPLAFLLLHRYPSEVDVLPGKHILSVHFIANYMTSSAKIPIDAKGGSNYLIQHNLKDGKVEFTLTEENITVETDPNK